MNIIEDLDHLAYTSQARAEGFIEGYVPAFMESFEKSFKESREKCRIEFTEEMKKACHTLMEIQLVERLLEKKYDKERILRHTGISEERFDKIILILQSQKTK